MKANTRYLLKRYAIVPIAVAYVIFMTAVVFRRGEYATGAVVCVVTIGGPLIVYFWARRKGLLVFKYPTADRAIALYHGFKSRSQDSIALMAYSSAFAATLYGDFDRAREELASINWSFLPPLYQGFETYIHSLLAIFEAGDYSRALTLAKEARDLCDVSGKFPGAKKSRATFDAHLDVCESLSGNNPPARLAQLDIASRELPGVSAAIPAWALATYHTGAGEFAEARRYAAIVTRLVPHCTPLTTMPRSRIIRF